MEREGSMKKKCSRGIKVKETSSEAEKNKKKSFCKIKTRKKIQENWRKINSKQKKINDEDKFEAEENKREADATKENETMIQSETNEVKGVRKKGEEKISPIAYIVIGRKWKWISNIHKIFKDGGHEKSIYEKVWKTDVNRSWSWC